MNNFFAKVAVVTGAASGIGKAIAKKYSMLPEVVAEKVFAGIHEKKLYIFTHPNEHIPKIQQRLKAILAGQ